MNPSLSAHLAPDQIRDRVEAAERRRARPPRAAAGTGGYESVSVRRATPDDAAALGRLAQLEGRPVPPEPVLLAEVGGRVLAARSIATREAIADPFQPTAELVELLDLRSLHLHRGAENGRPRRVRGRSLLRALLAPLRS